MSSGTHLWSAKPLRQRLADELGDLTFEELPVTFQVCAASIERAAEHWFSSGRVVDAVVASAAVPGLLPPAEIDGEHYLDGGIVNSVPLGRAVQLGATRVFVLQVGRLDRPLQPPKRPWEVARVSFEIARRHRFVRELAELPDDVECHVLPARGTSTKDDTLLGSRDFSGVQARIDATYDAANAYLDEHTVRRRARRLLTAPVVLGVTALLWLLLPLWLVAAAALSPLLPGRWRALRLLWIFILYATLDSLMLVVMTGYWLASGFGWKVRSSPYWQGLHYDLVQGVMWVLFREAKRVLKLDIVTEGPVAGRPPRPAAAGLLPARGSRRLVRADPRADALVRPRAAGGAQGHPAVGPGDRRAAAPDPGAVHLAQPRRGRGPGLADHARWRPAWTRTTPS